MKLALIVNTTIVNSYSALKFAKAAIDLQHTIAIIFFTQQGVNIANACIDLPVDEINLQQDWQTLAIDHAVSLIVCTSSALRRGIPITQLATTFLPGSIGQLAETLTTIDRVITFK